MKIVNVIKLNFGVVDNITSFVIPNKEVENEIVEKAETLFIEIVKDFGYKSEQDSDLQDILSDGYYHKNYDPEMNVVCICWSNIE